MKKMACVLALVLMLVMMLTGCVGKFKCALCGEEKFGVKNEKEAFGVTVTYCNDCKDSLNDLKDMFS